MSFKSIMLLVIKENILLHITSIFYRFLEVEKR